MRRKLHIFVDGKLQRRENNGVERYIVLSVHVVRAESPVVSHEAFKINTLFLAHCPASGKVSEDSLKPHVHSLFFITGDRDLYSPLKVSRYRSVRKPCFKIFSCLIYGVPSPCGSHFFKKGLKLFLKTRQPEHEVLVHFCRSCFFAGTANLVCHQI